MKIYTWFFLYVTFFVSFLLYIEDKWPGLEITEWYVVRNKWVFMFKKIPSSKNNRILYLADEREYKWVQELLSGMVNGQRLGS